MTERSAADPATAHAWRELGGATALVERVTFAGTSDLGGVLPTRELARASVAVCSLAAAELLAVRTGRDLPAVHVDEGAVSTAFASERHLRVDGQPIPLFAPLSGFWRAADGWVRTHANYPHHRARLLTALGLPDTGDDTALAHRLSSAIGERPAVDVQETVYAAGGLAVAVAPAGAVDEPLVTVEAAVANAGTSLPPAALPAQDVRVLDLTRVLAGPVATRTLALLGADVLRVDPPWLPEADGTHIDTGFGKRTTRLALDDAADRATFEQLLGTADVVVLGYRPGALDRHGLSADALLARHPRLVVTEAVRVGVGRTLGRPPRVRQPGPGGHGHLADRGDRRTARHPARAGARPRHGLPRGSGGPAGAHHPDRHRSRPAPAAVAGGHRHLVARDDVDRNECARLDAAGRRARSRCAPALAGRDRLPLRTAAARCVPRRRGGHRGRLERTTAPVGHGRAPLAVLG